MQLPDNGIVRGSPRNVMKSSIATDELEGQLYGRMVDSKKAQNYKKISELIWNHKRHTEISFIFVILYIFTFCNLYITYIHVNIWIFTYSIIKLYRYLFVRYVYRYYWQPFSVDLHRVLLCYVGFVGQCCPCATLSCYYTTVACLART